MIFKNFQQIIKKIVLILLFFLIFSNKLYAANVAEDTTISSDTTAQQVVTANDVDIILTDNASITRTGQKAIKNTDGDVTGTTLTIHSGSAVTSTGANTISTEGGEFTVTNSGEISTSVSKAINLSSSDGVLITNNSGGVISADGFAILGDASNSTDNITIDNSGKIFSTKTTGSTSTAIILDEYNNGNPIPNTTITNNAGGSIYSEGPKATIKLGTSSTITNSGSIKNNKSVDKNSIELIGNNNTVTLKDEGIVVGKIKAATGTTGNTLKFNHGLGKSYYYNTGGDFTLEDLDGNQVVQGSAGSVGQGGSETVDDLLGYKSLNIRKSLNRFTKSKDFKDKKTHWQGIQATRIKRKEHTQNLALGYEFYSLGVNIIRPSENENVIASFEYSEQDFQKDHTITRYKLLFGLHYNESENKFKDNSFILAGATLNEGERKILTNTTSSGTLNIDDDYESFEIHTGKKFKNKSLIPNIGTNLSYSYTPAHSETKYYSWEEKHVANFSVDLNDEFTIVSEKTNSKLGIGWILDYRTLISDSGTKYSVNGTKATYKQDNDLKKEMTISANINYEKKIRKSGIILISLDGTRTTQKVYGVNANISFVY